MNKLISVIIPTFNGAHKIINLLQTLENQDFVDFEIIVVIDGSTDNSLEVINSFRSKFSTFSVINQENGGRSKSRNAGANIAKGELLVFFDDDMRVESNTLSLHMNHYLKFDNSICIGTQLDDYTKLTNDIQKYKAFLARKWAKPLEANNGLIPKNKPYLTAAHFSIPTTLFKNINGFDENLTDAEDYDLAVRLSLQNIDIYYNKEIIGWHDDFITLKSYIKRVRQYTEAHKKLKVLKPELYNEKFVDYQPSVPNFLKFNIYKIFSISIVFNFINSLLFVKVLPVSLRYKIYDITIASLAYYFPDKKL